MAANSAACLLFKKKSNRVPLVHRADNPSRSVPRNKGRSLSCSISNILPVLLGTTKIIVQLDWGQRILPDIRIGGVVSLTVTTGATTAASICMPAISGTSVVPGLFAHQVSLPLPTRVEVSQVNLHVSLPTLLLPPLQNSLLQPVR